MKTFDKYLWMILFSLFLLGACSSCSDDIPEPEPKPAPNKPQQESASSGSSIDDMKNKNW